MENSDLIMRALITRVEHLESELSAAATEREELGALHLSAQSQLDDIASHLFANPDIHLAATGEQIIAELQRRGVMNGGAKP